MRSCFAKLTIVARLEEPLCLGLFWQPAAHCRHTLFGIEKQPKFTWTWVRLLRGGENLNPQKQLFTNNPAVARLFFQETLKLIK